MLEKLFLSQVVLCYQIHSNHPHLLNCQILLKMIKVFCRWYLIGEANFSHALIASEYWEALEYNEVLALKRIDYGGNTFASFREWFLISFGVFATRNTGSLLELFTGINSMAYFLSVHNLSDELEKVTFLSFIVGWVILLFWGKTSLNFIYLL